MRKCSGREPGYLDGPEALGDPGVRASRGRVLESLDSPGAGVDGRELIERFRGYVMRIRPEGLCAALGDLIVPSAEDVTPSWTRTSGSTTDGDGWRSCGGRT